MYSTNTGVDHTIVGSPRQATATSYSITGDSSQVEHPDAEAESVETVPIITEDADEGGESLDAMFEAMTDTTHTLTASWTQIHTTAVRNNIQKVATVLQRITLMLGDQCCRGYL